MRWDTDLHFYKHKYLWINTGTWTWKGGLRIDDVAKLTTKSNYQLVLSAQGLAQSKILKALMPQFSVM